MNTNNSLNLDLFKHSSIGTTVESSAEFLAVEYEYTLVGWFFITIFGTTQRPRKISFTCIKTNEVFEVITEPKLIDYFTYYSKK